MKRVVLPALKTSLAIFTGAIFTGASTLPVTAEDLSIARLHGQPSLSGVAVRGAEVSPDGSLVTILQGRADNAAQLDLWAYDLKTGQGRMLVSSTDIVTDPADLSEEEKNRRERQRIYTRGIISYQWGPQGNQILFPLGGDVYVYSLEAGQAVRTTQTDAFETDPKFSPKGNYVSYIRSDELFVYNLITSKERKVTKGAGGTIRNGVSELVAQEELDRFTGYWWSPDETKIAYTQIDEAPVPLIDRMDIGADGAVTIQQRYPFAGTKNVAIKLGFTRPDKAKTTWADLMVGLDDEAEIYLADVFWSQDGSKAYASRLTRDQKRLDLLMIDPATGTSRILFTETSETWVNLGLGLYPLQDGGFLWSSERSGFQQMYRYGPNGEDLGAVTGGNGMVTDLDCVDEEKGMLFYTGWHDTPLDRHLYTKSLRGKDLARPLTDQPGWTGASYSQNCDTHIRTYSNPNQPTQVSVHERSGERVFWLNENTIDENHPYAPYSSSHGAWSYGQIEAEDGTPLDYRLLIPATASAKNPVPAIIIVYGGPHGQRVHRRWGNLMAQMLVDKGYAVFQLDNRGAGNRGTKFEDPLYRALGGVETRDQAAGATWLAAQPSIDADKIGVYGWSYGGYMALHMLMQNPDLYASGVAGAPVSDWKFYDTAYTERYMGHPEKDAKAYEASSPLSYVDTLEDPLLVIHGMADDNVVFQNTVKLIDVLQKKGKTFELMTYPGEKHGFRKTTSRIHRDQMIVNFFERTLKE